MSALSFREFMFGAGGFNVGSGAVLLTLQPSIAAGCIVFVGLVGITQAALS